VQRYAPEMERRLRSRLIATNDSCGVDETYIRVKDKWRYLYRPVDSSGATLDFLLSAKQMRPQHPAAFDSMLEGPVGASSRSSVLFLAYPGRFRLWT
jgi:hypothetical protein